VATHPDLEDDWDFARPRHGQIAARDPQDAPLVPRTHEIAVDGLPPCIESLLLGGVTTGDLDQVAQMTNGLEDLIEHQDEHQQAYNAVEGRRKTEAAVQDTTHFSNIVT
jgi:hypothetical protein